jgi:hypothetical protein
MLCHNFLIGKGTHAHREPRVFWEDTRQPVERGSEAGQHTPTLSLPPVHTYHGTMVRTSGTYTHGSQCTCVPFSNSNQKVDLINIIVRTYARTGTYTCTYKYNIISKLRTDVRTMVRVLLWIRVPMVVHVVLVTKITLSQKRLETQAHRQRGNYHGTAMVESTGVL